MEAAHSLIGESEVTQARPPRQRILECSNQILTLPSHHPIGIKAQLQLINKPQFAITCSPFGQPRVALPALDRNTDLLIISPETSSSLPPKHHSYFSFLLIAYLLTLQSRLHPLTSIRKLQAHLWHTCIIHYCSVPLRWMTNRALYYRLSGILVLKEWSSSLKFLVELKLNCGIYVWSR